MRRDATGDLRRAPRPRASEGATARRAPMIAMTRVRAREGGKWRSGPSVARVPIDESRCRSDYEDERRQMNERDANHLGQHREQPVLSLTSRPLQEVALQLYSQLRKLSRGSDVACEREVRSRSRKISDLVLNRSCAALIEY